MLSVTPRCPTKGALLPAVTDCDATIAATTEHQKTAAPASVISSHLIASNGSRIRRSSEECFQLAHRGIHILGHPIGLDVCRAVDLENNSLSFVPAAFAKASSVMYRLSALLPAIMSSP